MQASYYTAKEVQEMLGVSKSKAYKIIRELNEELKRSGYIVMPGKISRKYLQERCYGLVV